MAKSRGVRGAAGFCAVASLVYLLVRSLLYALVSTLMAVSYTHLDVYKRQRRGRSAVITGVLFLLCKEGTEEIPNK